MLTKRQEQILKIIIESYVKTVEPLSSSFICEKIDVSSATIRNEMTILEDYGFIAKPHYASGRVPTSEGYKFYVDNIVNRDSIKLKKSESTMIRSLFTKDGLVLKDAVFESVKLISQLTNYSVIMLGGNSKFETLREVKVVPVDNNSVVSIIVTNLGNVFNQLVKIEKDIDMYELEEAVNTINNLLKDTPINEINAKLEDDIKPVLRKFMEQNAMLCEAFLESIKRMSSKKDIIVEGQNNLIYEPEFDDADKIRELLNKIGSDEVIKVIEECNRLEFAIGEESISNELSMVSTNYDDSDGKIAVIGPKRMDYERVVGLLNEIKKSIELLNEEEENEKE